MTGNTTVAERRELTERPILTFSFYTSGYMFRNWIQLILSVVADQVITFTDDTIFSENVSADKKICAKTTLYGDEINLVWDRRIAKEDRRLSLSISKKTAVTILNIRKKDSASCSIIQMINPDHPNFEDPESSDNFYIKFYKTLNHDGHQSVERTPYTRVKQVKVSTNTSPSPERCLNVPIPFLARIIDPFRKRKVMTSIKIHSVIGDDGAIENIGIHFTADLAGLGSNMSESVGDLDTGFESEETFDITTKNIGIISSLAQMHKEGTVHVYYEPGVKCLKFSHNFGSFGFCEIYISKQ